MEKSNTNSSWRLESEQSQGLSAYFQRAGSFGHILFMILFYAAALVMYWAIWKSA